MSLPRGPEARERFLRADLIACAALRGAAPEEAVKVCLEATGSVLLGRDWSVRDRFVLVPDPQALQPLGRRRRIFVANVRHRVLGQMDPVFSFGAGELAIGIGTDASFTDVSRIDSTADAVLRYMQLLYDVFRPEFGFVYENTADLMEAKDIEARRITRLYWANFFGPGYVAHYGADYLLGAPGWRKERLPDGGVLYVVTEHYTEVEYRQLQQPLDYFWGQCPGIRWAERGIPNA